MQRAFVCSPTSEESMIKFAKCSEEKCFIISPKMPKNMFAVLNFYLLQAPIYRLSSTSDHHGIMQVISKMRTEPYIVECKF